MFYFTYTTMIRFPVISLLIWGVVRGLIDIVVVLLISTSWTPMLERAGSIPSCDSMRLGCQVPADWRWFINFPTIKLGKSRYRLYWVESTINQEFKKKKKNLVNMTLITLKFHINCIYFNLCHIHVHTYVVLVFLKVPYVRGNIDRLKT